MEELDGSDKVVLLAGDQKNASFALPLFKYPMVNKPLTFELTVTSADESGPIKW